MNFIQEKKDTFCYGYFVSPINGMDMWSEVEIEELQPPLYKLDLEGLEKLDLGNMVKVMLGEEEHVCLIY